MHQPAARTQRRSNESSPRSGDPRDPYERDRARIIHSAAFRRLQAKTQVLGISEGDFHRTRLTHTMEVAQIARGIVLTHRDKFKGQVLPSLPVIEAIAFCHDLGHSPFGHSGEIALNYAMRRHGGFEGNGHSLRLATDLEAYHPELGLDLTRRTLLGILKYPVPYSRVRRAEDLGEASSSESLNRSLWKPPKCYLDTETDVVDWIFEPLSTSDRSRFQALKVEPTDQKHGESQHKALDTSIMEIADDIAYGVHDFEDGIALGLIGREDWNSLAESYDAEWGQGKGLDAFEALGDNLFGTGSEAGDRRKRAIGGIVNALVTSTRMTEEDDFESALLRWNAELDEKAQQFLKALDDLKFDRVVKLQSAQALEYRGRYMILRIFEALQSDPKRLLRESDRRAFDTAGDPDASGDALTVEQMRIICDYVAGMTDQYATRVYEQLFVPRQGTIFQRF